MISLQKLRPIAVAGLALVSAGLAAEAQQQGPPPALVEVGEATTEMMAPQVFMPGTVVSLNDSRIAAEIAGRVTWVAPEGTRVASGDVIAEIDDRNLTLAVARGEAQVARLEARLAFLEADLARTNELVADNYAPASRLDEATSTLAMARQDLAEAQVTLKQARIDVERTRVRAPFPGRVVERLAQVGEYSAPGREILRLVDTEHLEVSAQAPVTLASVLKDGQTVTLKSGEDRDAAALRAIVPVGDTVSRTMELRVRLATGSAHVVGQAVEVGVPTAMPAEVIAVPRDALVLRGQGAFIFRITEEGTAERLAVQPGAAQGAMVAVAGGVRGGDRVIVRGGERLRPGQAVQVRDLPSAASR